MGTLPNDLWGAGKVRAHQAANLGVAIDSRPPIARGTAKRFADRLELDASASTDPEAEAVTYRWDLDYDGEPDLGPLSNAQQTTMRTQPVGAWVKLEVTDPHGRVGRVLIRIEEGVVVIPVVDAGAPPDAGAPDAGSPESIPDAGPGERVRPVGCGCSSGPAQGFWLFGLAALARLVAEKRGSRSCGADGAAASDKVCTTFTGIHAALEVSSFFPARPPSASARALPRAHRPARG